MEINITRFFEQAAPMDYSASVAEIGRDAGKATWKAACDDSEDFMFIDTDEKREAWRAQVKSMGDWSDDEIAAWSAVELNALFIQEVSACMREMGMDRPGWAVDWAEVEQLQNEGVYSSRIYRGESDVFYTIGE